MDLSETPRVLNYLLEVLGRVNSDLSDALKALFSEGWIPLDGCSGVDEFMLLKEITEVIDVEARLGAGYEMGSVPLCEVDDLSLDSLEPEVGVLSADVWI
jgi:hypothetical protein